MLVLAIDPHLEAGLCAMEYRRPAQPSLRSVLLKWTRLHHLVALDGVLPYRADHDLLALRVRSE